MSKNINPKFQLINYPIRNSGYGSKIADNRLLGMIAFFPFLFSLILELISSGKFTHILLAYKLLYIQYVLSCLESYIY